jgi:hypothetical protein
MNTLTKIAAGAGALVLAASGVAVGTQVTDSSSIETVTVMSTPTPPGCNDWPVQLTTGECQAAGVIRYVALYNLQGAAQFCKWRGANPGEWSRLKGYAQTNTSPLNIVTWLGGSIKNELEAYFVTGAPTFTIQPNTAPNACTGKLLAPPVVAGVTPGQTDATVTVTTVP